MYGLACPRGWWPHHSRWPLSAGVYRSLSRCGHLGFTPFILIVTKLRLEEIMVWCHVCAMNVDIRYCYWKQGTWPRWRQRDKGLYTACRLKNGYRSSKEFMALPYNVDNCIQYSLAVATGNNVVYGFFIFSTNSMVGSFHLWWCDGVARLWSWAAMIRPSVYAFSPLYLRHCWRRILSSFSDTSRWFLSFIIGLLQNIQNTPFSFFLRTSFIQKKKKQNNRRRKPPPLCQFKIPKQTF